MSQNELAKLTGYTDRSSIAKIEKGEVDLTESKIKAFADALNVRPAVLMGWEDDSGIPNFPNIHPIETFTLPMLGKIACGEPMMMEEEREYYTQQGTKVKADFTLICKGDSMIDARINDGDIVFVRRQATVENGEIAAVAIGDEATLKRFYYYKEQEMIILKPANPKYEDMIFTGNQLEDVRILGKAVAFHSDIK